MRILITGFVALGLCACGDQKTPGGSYGDYDESNTTVIGSESAADTSSGGERIDSAGPTGGDGCVQVSDTLCVPVDTAGSEWCEREGGPVDVIIVDGEVVEVVCYPPATDADRPLVTVDSTTQGDIEVVQNANNTTVVFNDALDGQPLAGDLSVDGNNVAVYGNGADKTIIDGDVTITGNNVRLRGVTITGDLTIGRNSAAVVLTRVLGNVTIDLNGTVFVENDVFGTFTSTMNGNLIAGNDVQGTWTVGGHQNTCDANHVFTDANANQLVEAEERADLLVCP